MKINSEREEIKDNKHPSSPYCFESTVQKEGARGLSIIEMYIITRYVCHECIYIPPAPQLPLQIHPIFVLSLVDCMLAVSYVIGGLLWLRRSTVSSQAWCYFTSLLTIVGMVECHRMCSPLAWYSLRYSSVLL